MERKDAEAEDVGDMLMRCPVSSALLTTFASQCDTAEDVERFALCFARYYSLVEEDDKMPYFRQMVALVMSIKFLGVDRESPVRGVLASAACREAFGDDVARRLATAECRALSGMARVPTGPTTTKKRTKKRSARPGVTTERSARRTARPGRPLGKRPTERMARPGPKTVCERMASSDL